MLTPFYFFPNINFIDTSSLANDQINKIHLGQINIFLRPALISWAQSKGYWWGGTVEEGLRGVN